MTITPTPEGRDVEVYRRGEGKRGVDAAFFQSVRCFRRRPDATGDWFVVEFEQGGTIEIPMSGACIWIEPERH